MPLFEYRCQGCELSFEELVSSSAPQVSCPRCRSGEVVRQLSTFAAHGTSDGSTRIADAVNRGGGGGGGTCGHGGCGHC